MNTLKKSESTLIIKDGVPYRLAKEIVPSNNDPCFLCELREICIDESENIRLGNLCISDEFNYAGFFVKDWDTADLKINAFLKWENKQY